MDDARRQNLRATASESICICRRFRSSKLLEVSGVREPGALSCTACRRRRRPPAIVMSPEDQAPAGRQGAVGRRALHCRGCQARGRQPRIGLVHACFQLLGCDFHAIEAFSARRCKYAAHEAAYHDQNGDRRQHASQPLKRPPECSTTRKGPTIPV